MVAQGEYMRGEWQREEPREAGGSTSFTNLQAVLEIQLVTSGKTLRAVKQGSNMTTFAPIKWTGVRVEMGGYPGHCYNYQVRDGLWLHERAVGRFQGCFRVKVNRI